VVTATAAAKYNLAGVARLFQPAGIANIATVT